MSAALSTTSDVYPCLYYDDAPAALAWLSRGFGFTVRMLVPGPLGKIAHSELELGNAVVMLSSSKPERGSRSPRELAGVHSALCVFVEDPDAHCARARAHGAKILQEPKDEDYGARGYLTEDVEGHQWYFGNYRPGSHWG